MGNAFCITGERQGIRISEAAGGEGDMNIATITTRKKEAYR